ncbi:MAG: metallophosphoesterase [Anaerolineales bacterium]|nr:metallophosphoesterase [Anaerolineales bacterium]
MTTAPARPAELDPPAAGEFSLVFLPDTQIYSANYPALFTAQTQWIADNQARYNIQAVLHVGDVVDGNDPRQWANADAAIRILDAVEIPYLIAIGNHDYDSIGDAERRVTGFNATFPPARYTAHAWWRGGFYEAGHSENAYCRLTIAGAEYLLLSLEFGPRPAVVAWANAVLERCHDHWAVLCTHSFLYDDGARVGPGAAHNPKIYPLGATAADGEDLWRQLVSRHANLHWVQSGHHIGGCTAYRADAGRDGTIVHQVFANWQLHTRGGDGRLRLVTLGSGKARVQTYSPALGQAAVEPQDKFTVTL